MWFAEDVAQGSAPGRIGKVDMSAQSVTEYQIPDPTFGCCISHVSPGAVTLGPDGKIWFNSIVGSRSISGRKHPDTVALTNYFGSVTTDGQTFSLYGYNPSVFGAFVSVAAGSDGNLWFTYQGGAGGVGGVAKVTTIGTIVQNIAANYVPGSIIAGPDNNLWFTEDGARIGRVTTSGALSEFSTGLSGYSISNGNITTDGTHIIFTATNQNTLRAYLGTMTTTGSLMALQTVPYSGRQASMPVVADLHNYHVLDTGMTQVPIYGGGQTTFTLPDPNSQRSGMVESPCCGIWYTDKSTNSIVQFY
ncbi:MAG TPA: hypothetical protein VGU66_03750 [Candidatus Elarobacter sp.]|nr:hypothetical protein [Candidatus Elarobacter sp.]